MSARRFGRAQKATALVPLALLSAAWTASLATVGGTTATAASTTTAEPSTLPDGTSVPTEAIEAPASLSAPGVVAPAARGGSAVAENVVATASPNGIPSAALAAYQRAETVINSADKDCNVPWQLVAAIGRVESDHGRFGGSTLDADGVASPAIIGIPLDGTRGTRAIRDTDAGMLDGDRRWDRAVGPMQFIPSTWSVVGVDADGDDERNPQDVDDAALASAVYLCSGGDDLSTVAGQRAAVFRYNNSDSYVDLVLSIAEAYSQGDFAAVPNGTTSASFILRDPVKPSTPAKGGGKDDKGGKGGGNQGQPTPPPSGGGEQPPAEEPTEPVPAPTQPTKAPNPVTEIVKDPTKIVREPEVVVEDTLTWAEARAECLAQGLTVLDVVKLTSCITELLEP